MLYQLEGRTGCQKKAFNISPLCGTDIEISSDGRYAACLTYSEKLLVFKRNIMSYQAYHQENAQLFQFGGPNTLLVRTDHSYFLLMLGRNPIARKPISITGMVSGNDALQMAAVSVDEVNRAVHFLMIPQAGILAAVLVTNSIRTGRTTSRLPVGNTGLIPHPARNVHSFSSDGMLAVISRKCAIDIWAKTTGATNRWKMHRRIASGKCTGMYAAAVSKKHNIVARVDSQGKHQLMSLIQGKNVKTWKSGSSSQRAAPEICITGSGRYVVSKFDGHLPDVHSAK